MTRLYGRAPRNQRVVDAVPHGHWKTSTFIGALRCDGLTAPGLFDGAINGDAFLAYVEQVPVPTLRRGDVVIMDISAHTRSKVCARRSKPLVRAGCSSHLTVRISTQSNRPSPSSKPCYAQRNFEPLRRYGRPSEVSPTALLRRNAPTSSGMPVISSRPENALVAAAFVNISFKCSKHFICLIEIVQAQMVK
jgi:hypothetical protein